MSEKELKNLLVGVTIPDKLPAVVRAIQFILSGDIEQIKKIDPEIYQAVLKAKEASKSFDEIKVKAV